MINIWTGKIGDGKSYHVVKNEVIPAVKAGRPVLTNLDIGPEHIRAIAFECGISPAEVRIRVVDGERLKQMLQLDENDKEGKHLEIEKQTLVVVDEAQKLWRAREFKETSNNFLFLLEWHRHLGLDIDFITQDVAQMDKAIGRLCNEFLTVKNLRVLNTWLGDRYVIQHREKPGMPVIATTRGYLEPKYFRFYRSMVNEGKRTHETASGLSFWKVAAVAGLVMVSGYRVFTQGAFGGTAKAAKIATSGGGITSGLNKPGESVAVSAAGAASVAEGRVSGLSARGENLRDALREKPKVCRLETQIGRSRILMNGKDERLEWPRIVTVCE